MTRSAKDAARSGEGSRVLFAEKVFLKRRRAEPLRGVEIFNVSLIRDLVRLGYQVTLPAVGSWVKTLEQACWPEKPGVLTVPDAGLDAINAVMAAGRAASARHDTLLLANAGKSLIPLAWLLWARGCFSRCVLIAHREATPSLVRWCRRIPGHVLAVNEVIARPFRASGHPSVHVDYGVMHAERFHPRDAGVAGDGICRFCVFGVLDNAWKGADTAVAAFQRLPDDLRRRSELHLASFTSPPDYGDSAIKAHPWIAFDDVAAFLRGMDVMLVPSRDEEVMRETFSQAMVQGMLTGLPVIASDLPVLAEKLDRGGGVLFRNPAGLVDAMSTLAADPAQRTALGARARETALARYVWNSRRFAATYLGGGGRVRT